MKNYTNLKSKTSRTMLMVWKMRS